MLWSSANNSTGTSTPLFWALITKYFKMNFRFLEYGNSSFFNFIS